MLQLMRECCSYAYPPLSIARYSFIQVSELEQCRVKKLVQGFNTAARIRTRVLVAESPKLFPWAITHSEYLLFHKNVWVNIEVVLLTPLRRCDIWKKQQRLNWMSRSTRSRCIWGYKSQLALNVYICQFTPEIYFTMPSSYITMATCSS